MNPRDIPVDDLDPSDGGEWSPDQWVRAFRSGFIGWLDMVRSEPDWCDGPGAPLRFTMLRKAARAAAEAAARGTAGQADAAVADLDPAEILDWTEDQLACAWSSGFFRDLPACFWEELAEENRDCEPDR